MSVKKRFDELGIRPMEEASDTESGENFKKERKKHRTYAFRRAETKKANTKVYEVGLIPVYGAFLCCFILAAIQVFLHNAGFYDSLPDIWQNPARMISHAIIYLFPGIVYVFGVEKNGFKGLGLHRFSPAFTTFLVLGFFLLALGTATVKFSLAYFFSVTDSTGSIHILPEDNLLQMIFTYAFIPAFCEELFLRGVLQTEITKKAGGLTGIIVSAICFAFLHFDFAYFVLYFVGGLVLAVTRHVCASVIPGMILHAANNILSMFFSVQLTFIASEGSGNVFVLVVLVFILFLLLLFYLKSLEVLCTKKALSVTLHNAAFKEQATSDPKETDGYIPFREVPQKLYADTGFTLHKFLRVLFSPALIITLVIFLFFTLV